MFPAGAQPRRTCWTTPGCERRPQSLRRRRRLRARLQQQMGRSHRAAAAGSPGIESPLWSDNLSIMPQSCATAVHSAADLGYVHSTGDVPALTGRTGVSIVRLHSPRSRLSLHPWDRPALESWLWRAVITLCSEVDHRRPASIKAHSSMCVLTVTVQVGLTATPLNIAAEPAPQRCGASGCASAAVTAGGGRRGIRRPGRRRGCADVAVAKGNVAGSVQW